MALCADWPPMATLIHSRHMDLATLVAGIQHRDLSGDAHIDITALACHTGDVRPGALFFCLPGAQHDGHDFAADAVDAGAAALVVSRRLPLDVPQVLVDQPRRVMARVAARFYGEPSRQLTIAAVTGTNGKTTTCHLLASVFDAAGLRSALLGTVVNRIGGREIPVRLTTAESLDLHRMFREMVTTGDRACAMEASSHALAMDRTTAIAFDAVVFSNLTRDHLDYHGDIEEYYLAKRRLFLPGGKRQPDSIAVVNVGDEHGRRLAGECAAAYGEDLWTYGLDGDLPAGTEPHALATDVELRPDACTFTLVVPRLSLRERLTVALGGRFNVANATSAAIATLAIGLPLEAVRYGLCDANGVAGRFESVGEHLGFTVLVDYAHTPDSLENVLEAARDICTGRLTVVFGCGGDRDRGKRPIMGGISAALADQVIVTSDNPRSEDPLSIIAEIVAGIPDADHDHLVVEPDRRTAIGLAIKAASSGDVVVIAGKGHETGQLIGSRRLPFDDREVARDWLARIQGAERL